MNVTPLEYNPQVGNLVVVIKLGYYGIVTHCSHEEDIYTVFLGNGLKIRLKRNEFVCLPLRYGQSLQNPTTAMSSFKDIMQLK